MDNPTENKSLRIITYILMAICAALLAWRLYQWSQGKDYVYNIATSLGFIFLFAAILIGKRAAALYYALLGAAVLCIVGSLALMFV